MSDCVDRETVLTYIDSMPSELNTYGHRMIRRIRLTEYISSLPAVAPERPKGHWKFKNDNILIPGGYYQCSECKDGKLMCEDNFCPNCGAKMEGD